MQGIVFDLDGTLVDSLADIADAVNRVLQRHGFPTHSHEHYKLLIGEGAGNLVANALPVDAQRHAEALLLELRKDYTEHLIVNTKPYDGVREMLSALEERGVPIAVLSNKPHAMTQGVVEALFPRVPFVTVLGQRPQVPRKPDPAAALDVARALGSPPQSCAFVGDTKVDMLTGKAAGMRAVGVTWGFRARQELVDHGADHLIDHPLHLLDLLPSS